MEAIQNITAFLVGAAGLLTGLTGFFALQVTKRKEKLLERVTEATAMETMQKVYEKFINDTAKKQQEQDFKIEGQNTKIGVQTQEISMLSKLLNAYKNQCTNCVNNKITET